MNERVPLIELNDLHHTYLAGTPLAAEALHGVSLRVYDGEAVGIIGRTGAGKSTVVQHFNGLIRPRERGRVMVLGHDMADHDLDVQTLRRQVGLVFQHPEAQLFERLVGDDVAFGPFKMGCSLEEAHERVRWAMNTVGLPFEAFKDRFTFSLSGGEMRKAAIAGVLALRPRVLVLDESTSGIDPRGRKELLGYIHKLHAEEGMTIVMISSNMEDLATLVDRIYVLHEGRTALSGTTAEVFSQGEALRRYGLAAPQITEVMQGLAAAGLAVDARCVSVEHAEEEVWRILSS